MLATFLVPKKDLLGHLHQCAVTERFFFSLTGHGESVTGNRFTYNNLNQKQKRCVSKNISAGSSRKSANTLIV